MTESTKDSTNQSTVNQTDEASSQCDAHVASVHNSVPSAASIIVMLFKSMHNVHVGRDDVASVSIVWHHHPTDDRKLILSCAL